MVSRILRFVFKLFRFGAQVFFVSRAAFFNGAWLRGLLCLGLI